MQFWVLVFKEVSLYKVTRESFDKLDEWYPREAPVFFLNCKQSGFVTAWEI